MSFPPNKWRHNCIYESYNDKRPVHPVPVVREVAMLAEEKTKADCLHDHLDSEDYGEYVVHGGENPPLCGPGGDGGSLHSQGDAVSSDENKNNEVKPAL